MPEQYVDWDFEDYDEEPAQKDNPIKALREKAKADSGKIKELQEKLSLFEKRDRERTVAEVLRSKGLDAKLAGLVPEGVEATSEAVEAFFKPYEDVFRPKAEHAEEEKKEEPTPVTPAVSQEDMQAYQRVLQAGGGNSQPPATGMEAIAQGIANAQSPEELGEFLRNARL